MLNDTFVRHNAVFFVGSMSVAVLNYLYHPILSRIMAVDRFGEVQALFSLYTQVSVLLSVSGLVMLHLVANQNEKRELFETLSSLMMYVMGACIGILLVATPYLTRAWHLETPWEVVVVALTLLVATLANPGRFFLQARRRFRELSTANIIVALGRLVCAAALVMLSFDALGAVGGLLIATTISFAYVLIKTRDGAALPHLRALTWDRMVRRELAYATLIFFATGFVTLLYTADVEIVKYLFPPDIAGYYSGIATVARIIFFATGSIASVLLPYITLAAPAHENKRYFLKACLFTGTLGGAGLIVMTLFPHLVITLLIGARYAPYASLLPVLALHTFTIAFINIFIFYFLALRTMIVIPLSIVGIVSIGVSLFFFHASPMQVVLSFLSGSVLSLIMFIAAYIAYGKR